MMARRSAVVVEVDPMSDGRCDELQHLLALVFDRVAIVSRPVREAEVDAKACSQPVGPPGNSVLLEDTVEPAVERLGDCLDVLVKPRLAISPKCRQPRCYRHH